MSETERAVGHPTALFRACDLSVRINHDLDLLPRRQPARRGQPVEHLKPFGLVIAIRHPPRQARDRVAAADGNDIDARTEEHTSELQSLMRMSYAVFCW